MSITTKLAIIPYLIDNLDILNFVKKNDYDWRLCQSAIPYLKNEEDILMLLEKTNYMWPVFIVAVVRLKKQESFLHIIDVTKHHYNMKQECQNRMEKLKVI